MDAMFQPKPHGAIAVDPLTTSPHEFSEDVNYLLSESGRCKVNRGGGQRIGSFRNKPEPTRNDVRRRRQPTLQELHRVPNFFNCRRSLAASASSQSRNVTILGSVVVAFGQMIQ
jgi:hypothetical protein